MPSRRISATAAPAPPVEAAAPARPPLDLQRLAHLAVADPRGRFAAALALGLGLGFLPAHVYAAFAEDKLDEIGAQLAREPAPQSESEYQLLLQQFDLAETRVGRVKARIMVVTGAIWLCAGGAAAYGYWRLMSSRQPRARDGG